MHERLTVQSRNDVAAELLTGVTDRDGPDNESAAGRREHHEVELRVNLRVRSPEAHSCAAPVVDDEDAVVGDVFLDVPLEVEKLIDISVGVLPHPHEDRRCGVDGGQEVPVLVVPVRSEIVEDLDEREGIAELQARVVELPVVLCAHREEQFAETEKALNNAARLAITPPCIEEDNLQKHRTGTVNHIRTGNELFAAVVLMMVEDHLAELVIHRDIAADIENEPDRLVVEIVVLDLVVVRSPDCDADVLVDVPDVCFQSDNAKHIIGVELARMDKDVDRSCGFGILEHLAESLRVLLDVVVEIDDAGNVLVVSHG